ncbi:putative F-box/LRR-repeat protein At5g02700 [Helianthus annuus]|uniref:putative F-box/LRR-repeat protein At5g02700 n=1 Tax=Helianthus annuus TaxID=4232 RepID=UPI000B8F64EE|nr:putative F-box/LRR-repeat protein At5g02700 [Helianthus annuus]
MRGLSKPFSGTLIAFTLYTPLITLYATSGGCADRISHLPESILHHILSFLNNTPADLVRMSVLSNTWFRLTASFAVLNFNIANFTHVSRQSFFKYLDYATSRFCFENLPAHTFKLVTTVLEPAELDVNRCLELLLQKGMIRELEIDLSYFTNSSLDVPKYHLPNILLSVSTLRSLTICGCDLPSSFMLDAVNFKSLIQLRLENVLIYDEVITYLATSCPLLQVIQIRCCPGFIRFCVHGHQNLQQVKIQYTTTPVERLDIEAPNLSSLLIVDAYGRGAPLMNLASCKKLTQVVYIGNPLPNSNAFRDFLSNFPFVETLGLYTHNECNNLMLSSHSLRTLVLCSNCGLEEIEFTTPKLVSFRYTCSSSRLLPMVMDNHWTLSRDSTHLKARMCCYPGGYIDTLWFQKLRYFLSKKNGFKVFNLHIHGRYSQVHFFGQLFMH